MRALVVDDSALFRRLVSECLASAPEVEVVGTASTGQAALQKARDLRPDLITLDMEMPGMSGLDVLGALGAEGLETNIIVVSALTLRGGNLTLRALAKGAFDYITKPEGHGVAENREQLRAQLTLRVRALAQKLEVRNILRGCTQNGANQVQPQPKLPARRTEECVEAVPVVQAATWSKPQIVLIGVSTGGPNALQRLFSRLPGNLGVPVVVVQHMPPIFTQTLAESLTSNTCHKVHEAVHGESLVPNCIYIAPGGKHMGIARGANRTKMVRITDEPPENNCKPAVDYLFRSVANDFPGESLAVILTGMGSDGTAGLRLLRRGGCKALAQDESTCVVFGMPKAAIDAGLVDTVLPLDDIAARITSIVRGISR